MADKAVILGFLGSLDTLEGVAIKVNTPKFLKWLKENNSFRYIPPTRLESREFNVRKEHPVLAKKTKTCPTYYDTSRAYWNLYYRVDQRKLIKMYVGKSEDITCDRLNAVAVALREEIARYR